ncbi:MAG: hypothetical protein WC459_02370 [Patescibacteria group bacterium]
MKFWLFYILGAIGTVLLEESFFAAIPFLKLINFSLLIVIYLSIGNKNSVLPFALASGYLLGIYSSYPFGLHLGALLIVSFLANYIYLNVLTNHRFFPVALLMVFCIFIYDIFILGAVSVLSFLKIYSKTSVWTKIVFKNIGLEVVYTIIFISLLYCLFVFLKNRISSRLLTRKKKYA